jgi:peptide/nickel transport system ATP-binding protein
VDAELGPRPPLFEARGIRKVFASGGLLAARRRVVAAQDVAFHVDRGEAVALVGESGSGKSTVARLVLRLEKPDGGELLLDGADVLSREPRRASLAYRGRVQMVFQDPFGSLNPIHDVQHHLVRPLLRHHRVKPKEARARALELLRVVGLEPAEDFIDRRPFELSGGQRQRVAIARALAVEPDLLVADEPTSMLDVSIRMGVLGLLARLKRERRLAILLITHDLASARYLADRILVLFRGRIVEDGPAEVVVSSPAHPYTRALLGAIAGASAAAEPQAQAAGMSERPPGVSAPAPGMSTRPPAPSAVDRGCPFAGRCPEVRSVCRTEDPSPRLVAGHLVRCHLYPLEAAVCEAQAR